MQANRQAGTCRDASERQETGRQRFWEVNLYKETNRLSRRQAESRAGREADRDATYKQTDMQTDMEAV